MGKNHADEKLSNPIGTLPLSLNVLLHASDNRVLLALQDMGKGKQSTSFTSLKDRNSLVSVFTVVLFSLMESDKNE